MQHLGDLCKAFVRQNLVSCEKREYDDTFGSEQQLNKDFQTFVLNYQRALQRSIPGKESKSIVK